MILKAGPYRVPRAPSETQHLSRGRCRWIILPQLVLVAGLPSAPRHALQPHRRRPPPAGPQGRLDSRIPRCCIPGPLLSSLREGIRTPPWTALLRRPTACIPGWRPIMPARFLSLKKGILRAVADTGGHAVTGLVVRDTPSRAAVGVLTSRGPLYGSSGGAQILAPGPPRKVSILSGPDPPNTCPARGPWAKRVLRRSVRVWRLPVIAWPSHSLAFGDVAFEAGGGSAGVAEELAGGGPRPPMDRELQQDHGGQHGPIARGDHLALPGPPQEEQMEASAVLRVVHEGLQGFDSIDFFHKPCRRAEPASLFSVIFIELE